MGATTLVLMVASVLGAEDVTLVQFSADWCEHCENMIPTVQRLRADGYPIEFVNVDQQKEKIAQHRVRALPTFIVMKNGRELKRVEGEVSYAQLIQLYEAAGYRKPLSPRSVMVRGQSPVGPSVSSTSTGSPPAPKGMLSRAFEQFTGAASKTGDKQASSTAAASVNGASAEQLALRASVKLRIEDETGYSFGSGTIIDTHGDDALILTCGHIFRESKGNGSIEVQIYTPQGTKTVQGKLLAWEPDYRDIGLVTIRPGAFVTAAKVASSPSYKARDSVFTIGCDHGADPSVRRGNITSLDRFHGSPNIEVNGKPTQGRSGGGLFNRQGELIGVCKLANPSDNEGIYAALPSIQFHLDKIGLKQVYSDTPRPETLANNPVPNSNAAGATRPPVEAPQQFANQATRQAPRQTQPASSANLTNVGNVREQARDIAQSLQVQSDTEVIVILRPKNDPNAKSEVLVVDSASDDLIDSIRNAIGRSRIAANAKVALSNRKVGGGRGMVPTADRRGRLLRGQSQH